MFKLLYRMQNFIDSNILNIFLKQKLLIPKYNFFDKKIYFIKQKEKYENFSKVTSLPLQILEFRIYFTLF